MFSNNTIPDVFNDIVEYLKSLTTDHSKMEYSCDILTQLYNNPSLEENKSYIIMYDGVEKDLYFQGKNDDVDFVCIFHASDDYSKKPTKVFAHLQDTNSDNTTKIYTAQIDLHTTVDSLSPVALPEFQEVTGNPSKEIIKTFRSQLSILLNEYFNELNNFYMQKVKNGDSIYTNTIYKYFYLPIIAIENINF